MAGARTRRLEPRCAPPAWHARRRTAPERAAEREPQSANRSNGSAQLRQPHRSSATLLRAARTNGELFLALPANEAPRNSINDPGSLLRVLCGGSEAHRMPRATAGEAEFRTQGGTRRASAGCC